MHEEAERRGLVYLTLLRFCEEGNNIPDGLAMAKALVDKGLCGGDGTQNVSWNLPACWALTEGSRNPSLW